MELSIPKYVLNSPRLYVIGLFISLQLTALAQYQDAYYVQLVGKDTVYDANHLLSKKALDRRSKYSIPIDYQDYPVKTTYIQSLENIDSIHVRYTLRWLNAAIVESTSTAIQSLDSISFVNFTQYVGKVTAHQNVNREKMTFIQPVVKLKESSMHTQNLTSRDYGIAYDQNKQIGILDLHQKGWNGNGISVAVFDAGFKNLNTIPGFLKHQANHKLRYGYDWVNMDNTLTDFETHGTSCASALGAYDPGSYIGSGPLSSITLFKTENGKTEYPIEELNWCKAAEIADSLGVDMITSSLGYNQFDDVRLNYTHSQLDGNTAFISRVAKIAVEKGIIVLNSAGNQGHSPWQKIGFPADNREVITVGAVDKKGDVSYFSSRGNNANHHLKPDLSAMGVMTAVATPKGTYNKGNGTSFSTPVVAGGVACLLQAYPHLSPLAIADLLRKTATQNHRPDSMIGYGIARFDVAYAFQKSVEENRKIHVINTLNMEFVVLNAQDNPISYTLYLHRKFLGFIAVKKKIQSESNVSISSAHYIPLCEIADAEPMELSIRVIGNDEKGQLKIKARCKLK